MRTVQLKISEADLRKYNIQSGEIKFPDLVELISKEYAKAALLESNRIAQEVGLSKMSLDEINEEIKAVRDAKNNT